MSRSEEFHGEVAAKWRVYTRDKDGNSLYLDKDVDAPASFDYPDDRSVLDHVAKKGMGWHYPPSGEWQHKRIASHEVVQLGSDGRYVSKPFTYPAGWKGDNP